MDNVEMMLDAGTSDLAELSHADGRESRKRLGAYYTPASLSDVLVRWAIRSPDDTILEPGFGGCGFIDSAIARLGELGCAEPARRLSGCDIDAHAFAVLRGKLPAEVIARQFPQRDFLACDHRTWPTPFTAAVGNPPYVAYQALGGAARLHHQQVMRRAGLQMPGRASLWAYFVVHATTFLQQGGRFAWVLPGSLLQADYAAPVRAFMSRRFGRLLIVRVHERLFVQAGADEETVILLGDNYDPQAGNMTPIAHRAIDRLQDLSAEVQEWDDAALEPAAAPSPALSLPRFKTKNLGELVRVKIGLVTGDNPFFTLTEAQAQTHGIPLRSLQPLLTKFSMVKGASLTPSDLVTASRGGARAWLATTPVLPCRSTSLTRYLQSYPSDKIATIGTFKKRRMWHGIDDGAPPDAFWPVMRDVGPVLALNHARVNCTNTIHRVYLREGWGQDVLLLALVGVASTWGQLSAERVGRHYGSGVLKHEPREAEAVSIPWIETIVAPALLQAVASVDAQLRAGKPDAARRCADAFFVQYVSGYTTHALRQLRAQLKAARRQRIPPSRLSRLSKHPTTRAAGTTRAIGSSKT